MQIGNGPNPLRESVERAWDERGELCEERTYRLWAAKDDRLDGRFLQHTHDRFNSHDVVSIESDDEGTQLILADTDDRVEAEDAVRLGKALFTLYGDGIEKKPVDELEQAVRTIRQRELY